MLCALWVLLSMLCRSGGNGAKFHQDARSDPREIHRRAPAPYDFLGGTSARGRNGREHTKKVHLDAWYDLIEIPKKPQKEWRIFRSLPALRKSRGRFWEWRRRAIARRVFFDIVEYSPRAQ